MGSYATAAELADALHTRVTPTNEPTLQSCVDAASQEADHWLDTDVPQTHTPALLHVVVLARAVEWAKANDAAFGIIGYADIGALRAPRDGFGRHASALLPMKVGWGIA